MLLGEETGTGIGVRRHIVFSLGFSFWVKDLHWVFHWVRVSYWGDLGDHLLVLDVVELAAEQNELRATTKSCAHCLSTKSTDFVHFLDYLIILLLVCYIFCRI